MNPRLRLLFVLVALLMPSVTFAAPKKAPLSTALNVQTLAADSTAAIAVTTDVPKGLHAQSHEPLDPSLIPFTINLKDGPAKVVNVIYPDGLVENYPTLGKVSVYTGKTTAYVIINIPKDAAPGDAKITGTVRYQMCDDSSCFAPVTDTFTIDTKVAPAGSPTPAANEEIFKGLDPSQLKAGPATQAAPAPVEPQPPQAQPTNMEGPTSLGSAIGFALLAGLIFNVMPCVLPVLPLKAVGFYEASHHNRSRTILFGLSFSAGMTLIFAALALVILLSKQVLGRQIAWGELFSHAWFVWTIAIVLGLLAVSMLRGSAIRLPVSLYGLNFRHDTMVGNFMWGGLTAILSTPCTAFLFPPILGYALAQPLVVGFITITTVGVGMALPYLVLSAFPEVARRFPRTGPFAELFKQMMGFVLLGSAGFFLGLAILRDPNQYWLVYAVVVAASVYLIVRTRQLMRTQRATIIATAIAIVLTGGGFAGAKALTRPSRGFEHFTEAAFENDRASGDIVLVKFTASWCLNCKYIEQSVFQDEPTLESLQNKHVRLLKADLTRSDAEGWKLLTELGGNGIPFTAVWPAGKDSKPLTLASIYTKDALLATVEKAKASPIAAR